ncbi:MAG: heparinase II/III family protein, partial [Cyclobacteriaceae bacterium]|nr:heparinase II/III family protein [Cyclobacteriaceae bacterium]
CIYDWLDKPTRKKLNKELFKPMADFLSVETPQFFNRIHNHSTWGNAAVGMIGIVMNDDELIQRALYGLDLNDVNNKGKDNDGGAIQLIGQNRAGFLAQIDLAFSPDGYYTEGPYYQRYAMYPFLIFAQALANNKPELKIFKYRDEVLIKAVYALLVQTNTAGEFFPINDSVKGMSILSRELVTAVSLAYHFGGNEQKLLSFIEMQDRVPLNDSGAEAAMALINGNYELNKRESIELSDGANGNEGALGILRSSGKTEEVCLVMKYTKQGMGHGHFDKLSFIYYHGEKEVFQDYGSARWVNIEQKDGGGYLKENTTWAKQTIAHNTLVVNNKSQYLGNTKDADKHHSTPFLFSVNEKSVQVMSAKEENAYPGVQMHRTMAMITDDALQYPLVLDIYRVTTSDKNNYDLPFYFQGHVMSANFNYKTNDVLRPMGKSFGYQHLWAIAKGAPNNDQPAQLSWFNGKNFYTLTSNVNKGDSLIFGRIGANDPNYNLRTDPVFILRRTNTSNTVFASTYEVHGEYSPVSEIATNTYSKVKSISIIKNDNDYSVIQIQFLQGNSWVFALSNKGNGGKKEHKIELNNTLLEWSGAYKLFFNTKL